jgi:alpha-ketoglutaric semialdehyde dehydrogenase
MGVSKEELAQILQKAEAAFVEIGQLGIAKRVSFMRVVASEIEALGVALIETAQAESHLPEARLIGEKGRTVFQWRSYADALERGEPLDASIDTANTDRTPPKPDIRKTNVGLGPVAVFGASNFPFAFSTAGGDTASAIAAGCPVIVKAHSGHPKTSGLMAQAILNAIAKTGMPEGTFAHVYGSGGEIGQALATDPIIKAIGFTGSYTGGMALVESAQKRAEPIPVFAEMGSNNPVFLLPEKLKQSAVALAAQYTGSLTLGVGQFCTNPGLLIGIEGEDLKEFTTALKSEVQQISPAYMLNNKIASGYAESKASVLAQSGVAIVAEATQQAVEGQGAAAVATVQAAAFLSNELLTQEVFGPFALLIVCKDSEEVMAVAQKLHGQLTATLLGTDTDLQQHADLLKIVQQKCGRIMFNNFPTGVEVCKSMHHGGPFPSSSNSQYTSVGSDSIKRFVRPLSFQNWPDALLPEELQASNPLQIWRTVDNVLSK